MAPESLQSKAKNRCCAIYSGSNTVVLDKLSSSKSFKKCETFTMAKSYICIFHPCQATQTNYGHLSILIP